MARRVLIRSIKVDKTVGDFHYYVKPARSGALVRAKTTKTTQLLPMWVGSTPIFIPTEVPPRSIKCIGVPLPKRAKLHMDAGDVEVFKGTAHFVRDPTGVTHVGTTDKVVDAAVAVHTLAPWTVGAVSAAVFYTFSFAC